MEHIPPSNHVISRSNSSVPNVSLFEKVRYNAGLLLMRMRDGDPVAAINAILQEVDEVRMIFEETTGKQAIDSAVLEIGFGARPFRAFALSCVFGAVVAVDLDAPVLTVRDCRRVFRTNGVERGLKSLARHLLFDGRLWKTFHQALKKKHEHYRPESAQFIVANAGSETFWVKLGNKPDLIFSSDVFEHIPFEDLEVLVRKTREHLAPGGIVITRPNVFTGISGGHDLEWYPHRVIGNTSESAWGHLLEPHFRVNTFLNRLRRADFADIFKRCGFRIVHDRALLGRLGERHLTERRRHELRDYSDYELFSNRVEFVLAT